MGIFDRIKSAIWGKEETLGTQPRPTVDPATPSVTASATAGTADKTQIETPQTPASAAPAQDTAAPAASVDVAAVLDAAVKKNGQKLDWRNSIVDLMKALDLDSSLSARKELASELKYTGDTADSATMNIWLHKALMKKLADNGGKVPSEFAA